jgi:hypothetical protein
VLSPTVHSKGFQVKKPSQVKKEVKLNTKAYTNTIERMAKARKVTSENLLTFRTGKLLKT